MTESDFTSGPVDIKHLPYVFTISRTGDQLDRPEEDYHVVCQKKISGSSRSVCGVPNSRRQHSFKIYKLNQQINCISRKCMRVYMNINTLDHNRHRTHSVPALFSSSGLHLSSKALVFNIFFLI
mmetsp:Transcript_22248/g.50943  ORF Transcript_22248/g.50943 Transcript_22248/m.50943 type:complete len:124 (-) Transcript_22248:2158-2529(-)